MIAQMSNGIQVNGKDGSLAEEYKVFNDVVHGTIELHPLCVKFVDTPQFQRLRYLQQCGCVYFVFSDCTATRFPHCLGVSHLAGEFAKALQTRHPEHQITNKDVLCVALAGLCHDLGHGAFSHMFEIFIHKKDPQSTWRHEQASIAMFDYMIEENGLMPYCRQYGLDEQDLTFIKEIIFGPITKQTANWPYIGRPESKAFLYQIVANHSNGVDVDKWDYIARDGHSLGIKVMFDHSRLMKFSRIINVPGEGLHICVRDKEIDNLSDLFHARKTLHRTVYQHRVVQTIETMIVDALLLADHHLMFYGRNQKEYTLSQTINDMEAYSYVTDDVLQTVRRLHSTDESVIKAKEILNHIMCRKLYPYIGKVVRFSKELSADVILQNVLAAMPDSVDAKSEDFVVLKSWLHYGMGPLNPIDKVKFYSKKEPDVPKNIKPNETSQMVPNVFQDILFKVICRRYDEEFVTAAKEAFNKVYSSSGSNAGASDESGYLSCSQD